MFTHIGVAQDGSNNGSVSAHKIVNGVTTAAPHICVTNQNMSVSDLDVDIDGVTIGSPG